MDAEATARKQKHVAEEYLSSLSDLQCNSKPLINMLTMLAEENIDYAPVIVKVVEQHIAKVRTDLKLPILYLIDSIVKNVQSSYVALFGQCIVNIFCGVFEKVNEKVRERMYALRQTWNEVFPASKLYNLDVRVKQIDKNWPITAVKQQPTAIHVNPNFLKTAPSDMEELLQTKTRELLELKKRKLELELEATKKHIEEQQKQLTKTTEGGLVLPLVDPNIDASVLATTTTQVPQVIPATSVPATHVNPSLLTAQPPIPGAIMSAANAGIYNQNFVRPPMGPRMSNPMQQKGPLTIVQQVHPGVPTNSHNKVKVRPVNAALLNCIRPRDPRLMRQQMQQPTQKTVQVPPLQQSNHPDEMEPSNITDSLQNEEQRNASPSSSNSCNNRIINSTGMIEENKRDRRGSSKSSTKSSRFNSAMDRSSKSPTSHSSHRSSKNSGSSSSSSTRSRDSGRERHRERERERERERDRDRERDRERERDRKRTHDGKSYIKSNERRYSKTTTSSSTSKHTGSSKTEKSNDEAATNASNDKQNRSCSRSPTKLNLKDSTKRSEAGRITHTINQNGPQRHSSSPVFGVEDDNNSLKTKDTDLRIAVPTKDIAGSDATMLELSNKAAVKGLEQKTLSTATTTTATTTKTTTTHSSPPSSSTSSTSISTVTRSEAEDNQTKPLAKQDSSHDMDVDESIGIRSAAIVDGKKRMSESGVKDEPVAKKSKSTKMDELFGPEDVDLRTLAPPIMSKALISGSLTPPPPPHISSDEDQQQDVAKTRENKASTQKTVQQKLPSNFEDVRAKFAKATRLNKFDRATEKARQKLVDLTAPNDDETTQEAEDEKIRIILSQAQEMLESNSLNQSQYKHLVQTVMSINEKNKLKEAKRRELLQQQNVRRVSRDAAASPTDEDIASAELSAARDAVLRKRIPKISKTSTSATMPTTTAIAENVSEKSEKSEKTEKTERSEKQEKPERVERPEWSDKSEKPEKLEKPEKKTRNQLPPPSIENEDAHDGGGVIGNLNKLKPKEKRVRHSKWSDRNESQANLNANISAQQQRNWTAGSGPGSAPKRQNISGMRVGCVPPPPQAPQPPMILGPNVMRPMHAVGGVWPQSPMNNGPPNGRGAMGFGNQMPMLRSSVPPPPQPPPMSIPPVLPALTPNSLPKPCNSIDNPQAELVRTITIDGQSKDIRIYDDVAIVFMELDEPREIGFQPGQRAIIFDNQEPVNLRFNDDYMPLIIAGEQHRVRFGFPSRELYIDENWYEIYFGGPPVSIPINNKIHILKAEGPPPQVNIGPLRFDLVVGKIHMIIEAVNLFPLFLDARQQTFRFNDEEHTVQFADNLLTVILDGQPIQVEYGGLPKSYNLGGKRYYIRFTTLPKGAVPGKVEIKDMVYVKMEKPKKIETAPCSFAGEDKLKDKTGIEQQDVKPEDNDMLLKAEDGQKSENTTTAASFAPITATTALGKINIDELFQKLVSSGILNSNATTTTTRAIDASKPEQEDSKDKKTDTKPNEKTEEIPMEKEEEKLPPIIPIDLRKADSIKTRQEAIIMTLYSGMQCSSCGVRFPPEQTIKYSQHLDWHFRQNRRGRDSTRKAHSRKWYYDLNDWLQYEEIEDLEEREKNFFEAQQNEMDAMDDASNQRSTNSPVPSCPAGPDDVDRVCDTCQEKFEQFYNEELEEWHLRAAIRVEDKIYHPFCYEDFKAAQNLQEDDLTKHNDDDVIMQEDDNAVDVVIKIEEDEKEGDGASTTPDVIIAEDDDDVIVLPNEEPSVTEIDDDEEEYVPVNVTRKEMKSGQITTDDKNKDKDKDESAEIESDVEIQEPTIPFTDLDTYEEKELPIPEETSQASFLNVKIKEEPKDDEDEDGDFEDVGTVMYGPYDEISIQSSEETQTQTILSTDSPITIGGENSLSANISNQMATDDTTPATKTSGDVETAHLEITEDSHISIDGNLEPSDSHNLSIAGPSPAVPLGTLINRIKINITKNASAAAHTSAASSATATPAEEQEATRTTSLSTVTTDVPSTATVTSTISSLNSNSSNNSTKSCNINTITNVVSTIPVLCAGGTMPSSNVVNTSNISNITVIGSYGNYHKPQHHHHHQQQQHQHQQSVQVLGTSVNTVVDPSSSGTTTAAVRQRTPTPPAPATVPVPVEETITYELKPALQNANLKKMKKINCGVETSGLCSIM